MLACAEGESRVAIASPLGISKVTVGKWRRRCLEQGIEDLQDKERPGRPRTHDRQRHFKISSDPFFIEKVRDIVGLYMNLPDHDVVLCVDEKTKR